MAAITIVVGGLGTIYWRDQDRIESARMNDYRILSDRITAAGSDSQARAQAISDALVRQIATTAANFEAHRSSVEGREYERGREYQRIQNLMAITDMLEKSNRDLDTRLQREMDLKDQAIQQAVGTLERRMLAEIDRSTSEDREMNKRRDLYQDSAKINNATQDERLRAVERNVFDSDIPPATGTNGMIPERPIKQPEARP
jgi:hypothetical protein